MDEVGLGYCKERKGEVRDGGGGGEGLKRDQFESGVRFLQILLR